MGDTEISWTHRPGTRGRTWNPTQGCSRISEGCRSCYAERLAARFAENGWSQGLINLKTRKWNGTLRLAPHKLTDPLRWREPSTVFANSMSDLFHESLADEDIDQVMAVMLLSPRHTFQVLTKRAARMREYMSDPTLYERVLRAAGVFRTGRPELNQIAIDNPTTCSKPWIWLGVSVENQDAADERIPELLRTPAAVRFLSCEPLLGPVDLDAIQIPGEREGLRFSALRRHYDDRFGQSDTTIDWVIAGCESGPGARPCDVAWLRSLRDQCAAAGAAFFLKQAEELTLSRAVYPSKHAARVEDHIVKLGAGSKAKSRGVIELPYLDGVQHAAFPEASR